MRKHRRTIAVSSAAMLLTAVTGCGSDSDSTSQADATSADATGEDATTAGSTTEESSTDATTEATGEQAPVIDPGDNGDYQVTIDPASFTSVVDNPYFPALPGTKWEYIELTTDGGYEHVVVEVLDERRTVMGVETIVVHDSVTDIDGTLVEDTYDWYAQDGDGNVWYFGEDTTSYEGGSPISKEGAWEGGVDGALPGIAMPADPQVSDTGYRQEYQAGIAEDLGQIIAVDGTFTVPTGAYDDIVRTRDWTPLEPGVVEEKTYAKGVGFVHESKFDEEGATIAVLTSYTPPG